MTIKKAKPRKDSNYYGVFLPLSFLLTMLLSNGLVAVAVFSTTLYLVLKRYCL